MADEDGCKFWEDTKFGVDCDMCGLNLVSGGRSPSKSVHCVSSSTSSSSSSFESSCDTFKPLALGDLLGFKSPRDFLKSAKVNSLEDMDSELIRISMPGGGDFCGCAGGSAAEA